jgi:hypothetical protein
MATCESNADCRAGYTCLDVTTDAVRQVLDINPATRRICTVGPPPPPEAGVSAAMPAICNAFDGSLPESSVGPSEAGDAPNTESSTDSWVPEATDDAAADAGGADAATE